VAVLLAAATAWVVDRVAGGGRWRRWYGVAVFSISVLLYSVTPAGLATAILAVLAGAGVGLASGGDCGPWRRPTGVAAGAAAVGAAAVVAVRWWSGSGSWAAALCVATVVVAAVVASFDPAGIGATSTSRSARAVLAAVGVASVGLVAWTGANDPQLSWFGPVTSNGDRASNRVALTFDDGPNGAYSLGAADILEARGTRGTFFMVGKAVDADPATAEALRARGHLLGNHSYHHDYWRWLDPGYPELKRTQDAFERQLGTCPVLYRPPHGQRTPFISAQVASDGMQTITWDVSGMDWSLTDGAEVARRILARVRPGSIILLHDGLDGNVGANRQVVLDALPIILDGLEQRGLQPVRLDELLGNDGQPRPC
jgi:peptidoglycan/xylan/chitin deacetylase (PgdA/CDA1 family)